MKDIQRILFGDLRPWLESKNSGNDYYAPLTRNLKAIEATFNPHYELKFIRHFSSKTQYYRKLIENNLISYCNTLFSETENASGNLTVYKIDKARKQLHSKIKETAEIIESQSLSLSYITAQSADLSVDKPFKETTYIIYCLLSALIKTWMEIQCHFENHIAEDDLWEVSDFYTQLLQINVPDNTFITKIQKIEITTLVDDEEVDRSGEEQIGSLSYKYLNINPANISDLFNALKKNNSIAQETSITDFKRIFSGTKVEVPIKWTGAISDLSYLIKLLNIEHKVFEKTKSVWQTVCACFVDENGNAFEPNQLKDQKKPKKSASEIEKIAKLMI